MTYVYKHVLASTIAGAQKGADPKQDYIDIFQETLNEQFYNASNWWTILEEISVGSQTYEEIDVRISHVINAETGLKLGDDWKTVYFKDLSHASDLGKYYIFDDNTWLVTNIEAVKNIAASCTIRRCNNTLRWIDESTGAYYEEPCVIEYLVKEPRDYATQGSPFMTPGGFLHIETQLNGRTATIKENQRFLFGNSLHWTCYKIIGTGVNDFRNTETYDNNSANILTLDLIANFLNRETDDIVNGIADVYTNVYSVILNTGTISGSATDEMQLYAEVLYNGDSVTRDMEWESSDTTIATVDENGLVTLQANGTCTITVSVVNNPAEDSCVITVSDSPSANNVIQISPMTNYILEGSSRTYSVYLYIDGVQQADAFTITCNGNDVPSTNYTFTQDDDNTFTITNILRDVESYLTVQCTTGILTPKEYNIYLRGAWQFDNA